MIYKFCIGIAIVFMSCNNKNASGELPFSKLPDTEGNIPVVSFDLTQSAGDYEMADHGEVEYVTFEETEKSMLADITKVILTDKYIFLLDIHNESLYRFDRNGKYVNTIGQLGRGPGEYTEVGDFDVSEKDQEIYLFADDDRKINIYDFNGKFKKDIRIGDFGYAMRRLNNGSFVTLMSGALYNASFWDSNGAHLSTIKQHDERIVDWQNVGATVKQNNQCFLLFPFNNTIYKAEDNCIKPAYKFDFGPHTFPSDQIRSNGHFKELTTNKQYAKAYYSWTMTEQSIWVFASLDQEFIACHYSKRDKASKIYTKLLIDKIPVGEIVGNVSDGIIFKLSPMVASFTLNKNKSASLKGTPSGILNKITEESNPFIAIVKPNTGSDL